MSGDLYHFTWDVAEEGYKWMDFEERLSDGTRFSRAHITAGNVIMPSYALKAASRGVRPINDEDMHLEDRPIIEGLMERDKTRMVKRYTPLASYPNLYQEFAETPLTQEGITAFANQYGLLSYERDLRKLREVKVTETAGYWTYAEPLDIWYSEIVAMQRCIELWGYLRLGQDENLARRISWTDDGSVWYKNFDGNEPGEDEGDWFRSWIALRNNPGDIEMLKKLEWGELRKPAFVYLQKKVNEHLAGNLSPRLLWDIAFSGLDLVILPQDLKSAMWLQLAQAIVKQKTVRVCEVCGGHILVTNKFGTRSDKRYCSGACRAKAYRDRKKR